MSTLTCIHCGDLITEYTDKPFPRKVWHHNGNGLTLCGTDEDLTLCAYPVGRLNGVMEIDHVVRIVPEGMVADWDGATANIYAPSLLDDELDDPQWAFFSAGYTGQDRYSGPIMHNSEFIGGQLERDILSAPGVYVAVASYYSTDADGNETGDDGELYGEGWAVVRLID